MNWTTETPTREGLYCCAEPGCDPNWVKVVEWMPGKFSVQYFADEISGGSPDTFLPGTLWYGPIAPPPLPATPDPA